MLYTFQYSFICLTAKPVQYNISVIFFIYLTAKPAQNNITILSFCGQHSRIGKWKFLTTQRHVTDSGFAPWDIHLRCRTGKSAIRILSGVYKSASLKALSFIGHSSVVIIIILFLTISESDLLHTILFIF